MRIVRLRIERWRNFRSVDVSIPEDSTLICLIGENGTGKSNILELISAAANRIGISPGVESPRGNPFAEDHEASIAFRLDTALVGRIPADFLSHCERSGVKWDGVITIESRREAGGQHIERIAACGEGEDGLMRQLAAQLGEVLRREKETNYLSLDADRSYPPMQVQPHQYAEALTRDWESEQWQKNRAFVPTRTMYDEWLQYFLAKESQDATKHLQAERRAAESKGPRPEFKDGFKPYKDAVQKVLPHLRFVGVDTQSKTLVFDSSGLELRFTNLSGGEREIAFIIGQIERFKLRRGFLLLDEPELHLNPDLLRNWVAYLRDTIDTGQVWISTHSLEAVETAGPDATFVLERTADTRLVEKIVPLSRRPVLAVLSAAVGSPAFSLRNLRFVYVEGDRQGRERDRFFRLYGDARYVRFVEAGGCDEIMRKLRAVRELAEHAEEQLCVGGVVDRDFRSDEELASLGKNGDVLVLPVHEVENFFLHPDAIAVVAGRSGAKTPATQILMECSDRFAGQWIVSRVYARLSQPGELDRTVRQVASELYWKRFETDVEAAAQKIIKAAAGDAKVLRSALQEAVEAYRALRASTDLWKYCMGKEVLGVLPRELGFQTPEALEKHILSCWRDGAAKGPAELKTVIDYVSGLRPIGRQERA